MNIGSSEQAISLKQLIRAFITENKLLCGFMMLLFILIALISMLRPILVGVMFHDGYQMKNIAILADYVTVLLVMNGLIIILSAVRAILYTRFEIKIIAQLQTVVMKKIMRLPVYFFDNYTTGDLVQRVLWINSLSQLFSSSQMGLFFSFLSLLFSFSLMFYFNWQLTLAVFVLIGLLTFFTALSSLRLVPRMEAHVKDIEHAYGFLFQVLNGISRIKLFARESYVISLWDSMYVRSRNRLQKTYQQSVLGYAFFNSIPLLLLLLIFSVCMMQGRGLLTWHFIVFFCGLCLLLSSIAAFYINAGGLINVVIAYRRVQPILNAPVEVVDGFNKQTSTEQHNVAHICAQNVCFAYPNSKMQILRGLDFQILNGQHVAFVGLSGSGKSTLLKLLLGFYFPQQGRLEINGQLVHEMDLHRFRANIGVALQDGQLMNGTILENIIGHSSATEEEAWALLSELGLYEFVAAFPMGIHTVVSQHMNLLSGGQKQMLLIARALVGNPQLLILDEATNSLDNTIQELITKRLNQLGMTRITIAHRLSTIQHADAIFVLHQGVIAQAGTYQELMSRPGLFHQLAKSQEHL